jgi:hypothetical protein
LGLTAPSAGDYNVDGSGAKLGEAEINTRINKVLACRINLNLGVDNTRVSPRGSTFLAVLTILSSHQARIFAQGLVYARSAPRGVTLPDDVVKWVSELCPQQKVAGVETKKAGLKCCSDGGESGGRRWRILPLNLSPWVRRKKRRGKSSVGRWGSQSTCVS